jgi:SSS family solute:Na+ symporter
MKPVLWMDYSVIVIFMVLTLGVGFYFMKFNKGASDYFKGGNKIPWLISGLSAFMTGFSAWTFTAASGIAYDHGIIIILMYIGNSCTFLFGYWLFAVRWRRSRISSPMEYLSERFDQPTRQTFSISTVFFDLFMVAVWLFALGEFMSAACQIPIEWVIIGAAVIILIYCLLGGLWAVVITDFLQGVILIPFTIILAFAAIYQFGGISQFIDALPPELLEIGHSEYSNWSFLVSWVIMVIFGYNTRAHAQRYYSVDTEISARKISILNFVLFLLGAFIWFIPPMATRILYPDIGELWPGVANPHEGAYAVISLTLLPHGLIGVMLAAIFSACMSNVSSFYNLFSAIITTDVIPKFYKQKLDDKKMLYLGRITTFAIGIVVPLIALIMVLSGKSAFKLLNTFNSIISIAYGPPALIGMISKKTPHWSGLLYFVVALILGCIGWFFLGWDIPENVFYVIPISGLIMFGSIFVSKYFIKEKEIYRDNRAQFFQKLDTPIDVDKEVGDTGDIQFIVFRFLAKATTFIALLSLSFVFLNTWEESVTIFLYSGITLGFAALFFVLSNRGKSDGRINM